MIARLLVLTFLLCYLYIKNCLGSCAVMIMIALGIGVRWRCNKEGMVL